MACVDTGARLSAEEAVWANQAAFSGFFDNGPAGAPWPEGHSFYAVFRHPETGEEVLADGATAFADGRIPPPFWDSAKCIPTALGFIHSRAVGTGHDIEPWGWGDFIAELIPGSGITQGIKQKADQIRKEYRLPNKEDVKAAADTVGEYAGRFVGGVGNVLGRGVGGAFAGFVDEASWQLIAAAVVVVVMVAK